VEIVTGIAPAQRGKGTRESEGGVKKRRGRKYTNKHYAKHMTRAMFIQTDTEM
jgi:hypothetical protein